jgi:UPF0755 protein
MFKKIIIVTLIVVTLIGGLIVLPKLLLYLSSVKTTENSSEATFFIRRPMDIEELSNALKLMGIISSIEDFNDVANYKKMDKSTIALGKYLIAPNTQYRTLLNGFHLNAAGNGNAEVEVNVTFNNCRDSYELAGKVSHELMLDSAKLVNYLQQQSTLNKLGFTKTQLPALFLPNTYKMYFDTDEATFVDRMAKEFRVFWTPERLSKLKKVGLHSPSEAVTLASIVYSEQGRNSEEWPIIAGLYLNRIEQGIKLQSDPTFKFCWGDELKGIQRLLNVHRDIDCAYNTYKINGLPPGPICIPPSQVVDAVLNRQRNNFIFMMAKPNYSGLHDFSVEYATHQKYARIYQEWLANELSN